MLNTKTDRFEPKKIVRGLIQSRKNLARLIIALFMTIVLLTGILLVSYYFEKTKLSTFKLGIDTSLYKNHSPEFKEKLHYTNSLIRQLQVVSSKSKDSETSSLLLFLGQHVVLVNQNNTEEQAVLSDRYDESNVAKNVSLFILEPNDKNTPAIYGKLTSSAFYGPSNRSIILKNNTQFSIQWKALMFLHELHHAKDYYDNSYNYKSEVVRAQREVDAHSFMQRRFLVMGGSGYASFAENIKNKFKSIPLRNWRSFEQRLYESYLKDNLINDGLSIPLTSEERGDRLSNTITAIEMELLEEMHPGSFYRYQTDLMLEKYKNFNQ